MKVRYEREKLTLARLTRFREAFLAAGERGWAHPFIDHAPEEIGAWLVEMTARLEGRKLVVCQADETTAERLTDPAPVPARKGSLGPLKRRVLVWFAAHPNEPDSALIGALEAEGVNRNTPRARRIELARGGLLAETGKRGRERTWRVTEAGRLALGEETGE